MRLEWQIAEGSRTAHVIDAAVDGWHTATGARKRSGPRALCGKYPQRNAERPWFTLPVTDTGVDRALRHYEVPRCPECAAKVQS